MNSVWILTSNYNDYNQHGDYLEHVWFSKPNKEQLIELIPRFSNWPKHLDDLLQFGACSFSEYPNYELREYKNGC